MNKIMLVLLTTLFVITTAHADSNGVWIDAEDIRAGDFGEDEGQTSNFSFSKLAIGTDPNENYTVTVGGNISTDKICLNNDCLDSWIENLWQESNGNLYYMNGLVGIGTQNPQNKLDVENDNWNEYVGNFENTNIYTNSEVKIAGDEGIYSKGPTGGYFRDIDTSASTYISRGDYSVLGYDKVRGSELCVGSNCQEGFDAIKTPNVNNGKFGGWETVADNRYNVGGGNNQMGSQYLDLDNKPILGVRLSGETDDGGVCVVKIGDFYASVGYNAAIKRLGPTNLLSAGSWEGTAWDSGAGNMATKTFLIEDLKSGIWSYSDSHETTCAPNQQNCVPSSGIKRGYYEDDGGPFYRNPYRYAKTWTYNKPLGLDYLRGSVDHSWYDQWYNDGGGSNYNDCKVEVLYGEWQ